MEKKIKKLKSDYERTLNNCRFYESENNTSALLNEIGVLNCKKAIELVNNYQSQNAIRKEIEFYTNLDKRVCRLNELLYGEPLREV